MIKWNIFLKVETLNEKYTQIKVGGLRLAFQEAPLAVGATVAAAALGGRYMIVAWQAFKTYLSAPRVRRFYYGGFEQVMTKREAALILGVR